MKLELHTFAHTKVLKCTDEGVRWSAQENTHKDKFDAAMADSDNTIVNYEDTQAYSDSVAESAKNEKLSQIRDLEASALRSTIAVALEPSNNTERGYLQDKKDQIDAVRSTL